MLRTNGGTFNGNGNGREALSRADAWTMFRAVKQDKLAEFVVRQPEVLSTRK